MSIDSRTEVIPANGQVKLPGANFFFMISATAPVTVQFNKLGTNETFTGIQAGIQAGRVKWWDNATIIGTPGVSITFFYGNAVFREDFTQFNQQIAIIAGNVAVATVPNATASDLAPVNPTIAGQHVLFAANLTRRQVTVFSDPANIGDATIFLRKAGGANDIGFIVPGTYETFTGTYGVDYRAPVGGDKLYIFEES